MAVQPKFVAHPNGKGILPEYFEHVNQICINPRLMSTSRLYNALEVINRSISETINMNSFQKMLSLAISLAFSCTFQKNQYVNVAEVDYSGVIFQDLVSLYEELSWERNYLHKGIEILLQSNDQRLRSILGLLGRGRKECSARKRMAFSALICAAAEHIKNNGGNEFFHPIGNEELLSDARNRIYSIVQEFIEDEKERAFKSAFLEPTITYFRATNQHVEADDTDVHGSNVYIALIEATTGIKLPRLALWDDEVKGVIEYFAGGKLWREEIVSAMQQPENIGRSIAAIPGLNSKLENIQRNRTTLRRLTNRSFIFNASNTHEYVNPEILARRASSKSLSNSEQRTVFSEYIHAFTKYFYQENILRRMFTVCIDNDAGLQALQSIFQAFKADRGLLAGVEFPELEIAGDCEDVRHWVWDIESDPPTFNQDAAAALFIFSQVLKRASEYATGPLTVGLEYLDGVAHCEDLPNDLHAIPSQHIQLSVGGDIRGGGTGREFKENLFHDGYEPWNKWLHPGNVQRSFICCEFTTGRLYPIRGYAMCSANDCPHRDPVDWDFEGRVDGSWITLHRYRSGAQETSFTSRWQWKRFLFQNTTECSAVRINILRVRRPGGELNVEDT